MDPISSLVNLRGNKEIWGKESMDENIGKVSREHILSYPKDFSTYTCSAKFTKENLRATVSNAFPSLKKHRHKTFFEIRPRGLRLKNLYSKKISCKTII